MDLEHIRREYLLGGLRRKAIEDCPFKQFQTWMAQAIKSEIPDSTAMTLATVSESGEPSQRIVLLKHSDEQGLVFFTNYDSDKGRDIEANPKVCLHFPWHVMERQVRVNGLAEKVSREDSLKYFKLRPRESQIAAWASDQSQSIESRQALLAQFEAVKEQFEGEEVSLPDNWGGYRVKPTKFEFWQGGGMRLHDRFEYKLSQGGTWKIQRLAP